MYATSPALPCISSALSRTPLRASSLIVTVFGDTIAPRGGEAPLGCLIDLVGAFGLGDRLVRTTVNRLAARGWLERARAGRRSYYRLSPAGRQRIEHASRRIYREPRADWDGQWLIVIPQMPPHEAGAHAQLVQELHWQGFGPIAPNVLAHPSPDVDAVRELLNGANACVFSARSLSGPGKAPLQALVWRAWELDAVARLYRGFIRTFQPMERALEKGRPIGDEQAFVVRTLVIHEFRRVLLRDPQLPSALLPPAWPGRAARELCGSVYRIALDGSERHVKAVARSIDATLPAASPQFYERFGGLLDAPARHPQVR